MNTPAALRDLVRRWPRLSPRGANPRGRRSMTVLPRAWLALPTAIIIVIAATSGAAATTITPSEPLRAQPPVPEERIPPPPRGGAVTWLPGQWRWIGTAGTEWQWERGHYVEWPRDRTASEIGPSPSAPNDWVGSDDGAQ
jgi:hypothetical protein